MTKKKPNGIVGRPAYEPTEKKRALVSLMAGVGCTQSEIAIAVGCSEPLLRRHYREELNNGTAIVHATLISDMFRRSRGDDSVAQRAGEFIAQTKFGYTKQDNIKHEIVISKHVDLSRLSSDALESLEETLSLIEAEPDSIEEVEEENELDSANDNEENDDAK